MTIPDRRAALRLSVREPEAFLEHLAARLADHLPKGNRTSGEPLRFQLYGARAEVRLASGSPRQVVVEATAADAGALATMRHLLGFNIREWAGGDAAAIRWTGDGENDPRLPQLRAMRVAAVADVSPRLRRLRLAGEDLSRFANGGLHVTLLIPPLGRPPVWPVAAPSGIPNHPQGEDALVARSYTIRRIDPAAGHLDIDFVLHEGASPGSDFARRAKPGDPVAIMGPGGGGALAGRRRLLAGDETALPAIARMLEEMPADACGAALIEVADAAEIQALRHPPGVFLRWLCRNGAEAGTTTLIEDAVRAITWTSEPDASVWIGCEFAAFRRLRALCRETWKRPRGTHLVVSYWRRGETA